NGFIRAIYSKMRRRLRLPEHMFPAQAFLNGIPAREYPRMVRYARRRRSYCYEELCMEFAEDPEEDEDFEGVRFVLSQGGSVEKVDVPVAELDKYLRMACDAVVEAEPDLREEIGRALDGKLEEEPEQKPIDLEAALARARRNYPKESE